MAEKKYLADPKKRFSSRVENYIKYRPSYPLEIIDFLKEKRVLTENTVIADIGSGTGILTKIFLDNGNQVYGVEPNKDMRKAAEKLLRIYTKFSSFEGSAETTGLEENCIDLIIAGQAFHWFDVEESKREFKRIIKPNGNVALIWNNRGKSGTSLECKIKSSLSFFKFSDVIFIHFFSLNVFNFYTLFIKKGLISSTDKFKKKAI